MVIGPATSCLLDTDESWNLAFLSYDYTKSLQHPDSHFTVNIRATVQWRLDAGGEDVARQLPASSLFASLLQLPAPRFVHLVKSHPLLHDLPMYKAYGQAWLRTIEERSHYCNSDIWVEDEVTDVCVANDLLSRFLKI